MQKFRFNDGTVVDFGRCVHNGTNYNLPGMTPEDLAIVGKKIVRDEPAKEPDYFWIDDGELVEDGDVFRQRLTYREKTPEEVKTRLAPRINVERDRRLRNFPFGGKLYDFDAESRQNVSGAFALALAAISAGAQPDDYRWADPDEDFTWIAQDNTLTTMDAQTCMAFGQAAAAWKADHIRVARQLKDMTPIPNNWQDDSHWPTTS